MIKSFKDKTTEKIWLEQPVRKLPVALQKQAHRRLEVLDIADDLIDLSLAPANRFHALTGNRKGQHSIYVNQQYRLCFEWRDGDAWNVELTDYH